MSGVVIVGYQGIGKSSCAGKEGCIDLESGNFYVGGKRHEDWHAAYCSMAQNLAKQGYTVFVSSHQAVRDDLAMSVGLRVVVVAPSERLRDPWIRRLSERYLRTLSDKDHRALMNALDRYEENVRELAEDARFETVTIGSMDYDLMDIVRDIRRVKARRRWTKADEKARDLAEDNERLSELVHRMGTCMKYSGMCEYCPFMEHSPEHEPWCDNGAEVDRLRRELGMEEKEWR